MDGVRKGSFGFRAGMAGLVVALVAAPVASARADDAVGGFFQQLFGGGSRGSEQPLPQPDYAEPASPPLTVRAHKHRRPTGNPVARTVRYTPEELKKVTIYTDKTLMRGDAVMTAHGVRVFTGSSAWPRTESDFVALAATDKMAKTVRKELTAIDVAARSDFRGE